MTTNTKSECVEPVVFGNGKNATRVVHYDSLTRCYYIVIGTHRQEVEPKEDNRWHVTERTVHH